MGNRMTDQRPIVTKKAVRIDRAAAGLAPPIAPLKMPKQVLTPVRGPFRRALALMITGLAHLRHGFRRIG